jgi:hypothetical protein
VPAVSAPEHHLARVGCQARLIEDVDQLDTGPRGGARSAKTPPLARRRRGQCGVTSAPIRAGSGVSVLSGWAVWTSKSALTLWR